jgi:hypothetical protein
MVKAVLIVCCRPYWKARSPSGFHHFFQGEVALPTLISPPTLQPVVCCSDFSHA